MNNLFQKLNPAWTLRLGLGFMYLYSGIDLYKHPTAWYWALPLWLQNLITQLLSLSLYLKLQGLVEVAMAVIFLAWFFKLKIVRWAALLSTLEMLGILVLAFFPYREANFFITFRDIGLLGASLALLILTFRQPDTAI